jgi:penicillin-binding protein 1C
MPGDVRTTLDLDLQNDVQGIIAARRADLDRHGAGAAAVAVMDNATGDWLAWEGSGAYFDPAQGGAIDGVVTPRQPGSALKPFTYALAFQRGFTPASILPDLPSHFPTAEEGILYSPRNYDGVFRGPMRARQALAGSENVPAVWLLSQMGVAPLLDLLRGLGFSTLDQSAEFYGYGLTLGDPEVRLDEMIAAYASLARGGSYLPPRSVLSGASGAGSGERGAENRVSGDPFLTPHASLFTPHSVMSQRTAFWITDILSDNEARAFVFGRGGSLEFPFPVAAKTGTSQAYRDNWTLGYTREVTVGVWVGNFDGAPMKNSSGVTGAGPIFHEVMLAAQRRALGRMPGPLDPPIVDGPTGMTPVRICGLSGQKETAECPSGAQELLPLDEVPPVCRWHVREGGAVRTHWPPEYRSWAAGREASAGSAPSPGQTHRGAQFAIENPPEGATYWIDPTLRPEFQTLEFRAMASDPGAPVSWILDGVSLGERPAALPLRWPLKPGRHRLAASDRAGHRAEIEFTVK